MQQNYKKCKFTLKIHYAWVSVLLLSLPNVKWVCLQPPTWFIWVCQCATILKLVSSQNTEMQATRPSTKTKTRKNNNCYGVKISVWFEQIIKLNIWIQLVFHDTQK